MSMKRWSIVLAALFATSLFVHVVTAADGKKGDKPQVRKARPEGAEGRNREGHSGMGGMKLMRAIDANGDGELSAEEIAGAVEAIKKLDKNNDGKIDKAEMAPPKREGGERPKRGEGDKGGDKRSKGKRPAAK